MERLRRGSRNCQSHCGRLRSFAILRYCPFASRRRLLPMRSWLSPARKLAVYDPAYLELAKRERLPLATLNRALEKAAVAEGVAVFWA
jgi:predicted nucleic acid-binding protein